MQELTKGTKISSGDQAVAVKGQSGRPNGLRRRGKPSKSQGPGHGGDGDQPGHKQAVVGTTAGWSIGGCDAEALSHL